MAWLPFQKLELQKEICTFPFIVCYEIAKCLKGNNKGKYNVPLFNDYWFGLWPNEIVCTTFSLVIWDPEWYLLSPFSQKFSQNFWKILI